MIRDVGRQNDVGYLEEGGRSTATEQILLVVASVLIFLVVLVINLLHIATIDTTTGGDGGAYMTNNHAIAHLALLTKHNQMRKFSIGTICTNILDGIAPTGIEVQLGQKSLQIGNKVK